MKELGDLVFAYLSLDFNTPTSHEFFKSVLNVTETLQSDDPQVILDKLKNHMIAQPIKIISEVAKGVCCAT